MKIELQILLWKWKCHSRTELSTPDHHHPVRSQHKQTNKPTFLLQVKKKNSAKKNYSMKIKTHLHNLSLLSICSNNTNNGYITDQGFSSTSSSSSPHCPSPTQVSHYRVHHRLRSSSSSNNSHRQDNNNFFLSILLRRHLRLFLLVPLFYISGLLMCMTTFSSILNPHSLPPPPLPGSVYQSPQIFSKLWPQIHSDNASAIQLSSMWKYSHRLKEEKSCKNITSGQHSGSAEPRGYLIVDANGGLNQQRSSICNAVAVAAVLNAILVIPRFDFHNIWKDPSGFGDIYDVNHFINSLKGYVKVVRELPMELMERYDYNISNVSNVRVKAWAPVSYYLGEVYPILNKQGVIRIAPFANRLAMEVPPSIQLLRCLTNYRALRFSAPISTLAEQLVNRMIEKSFKTGGKYVSVHLRFEEDMVAFSCCVYDGGKTEELEMDYAREKGWRDKFKRPTRIIRPDLNRINGKCPLTPLEVGMMLRGMGFDNNTSIYLASGKIYHAEKNLTPLLKMFPLLQTKETLVTSEELASFEGYASRLAALDYTVCLFSEVFVTTQGGNFPHFLMGHRRFLYGHAKTIKPDKRKLVLLLQDMSISWNAFKEHMRSMLVESDREGMILPIIRKASRRSSIYANPSQECMCLRGSPNPTVGSIHSVHALDQEKPKILK